MVLILCSYNGFHSEDEVTEDEKNDYYLNHCCDPNVWYKGKDVIAARRFITKGSELFYDYANILFK